MARVGSLVLSFSFRVGVYFSALKFLFYCSFVADVGDALLSGLERTAQFSL